MLKLIDFNKDTFSINNFNIKRIFIKINLLCKTIYCN